jgi:hypothetical protein
MRSPVNKVLFDLNDKWRLGFDELQWIVMKKAARDGEAIYRPVSFIASRKAVLIRVLDDLGVTPSDVASTSLARLPDSFRAFQKLNKGDIQHD